MSILANSNAIESGGYNLDRSLRFRSSASAYLNRTPASSPTDSKKFTYSTWVKKAKVSTANQFIYGCGSSGSDETYFGFNGSDKFEYLEYTSGAYQINLSTTAVYRDPSAWYHLVLVLDTTQATSSDRVKLYINGVQQTLSGTFPSLNYATSNVNSTDAQNINRLPTSGGLNFDGYYAETVMVDGQALTPSSFGQTSSTTGVWQPAKYTGSYGTNGFYLPFTDTSSTTNLVKDSSGNANNWTPNNISLTAGTTYDSMTDVPTLTSATAANYAVLNPVFGSTNITFSEANLKAQVGSTGSVYRTASGTFAVSSGKWYWELVFGNPTTGNPLAGIGDITVALSSWNADTSTNANFWYLDASSGNKINGSGGPGTAYGSSFTTSDICMVALDMDNGKIWWGKNGTWFASGDPAAGTNAAYTTLANKLLTVALMGGCGSCGFSGNIYQLNFGQRPFSYTPPTGFVALNTFNLPTPTIGATASTQANKYFNPVLYTGNGSTQSITGVGFQPDFVWVKSRSSGAYGHALFDAVRGLPRRLASNLTEAENTTGSFGQVSAFGSDGFTVSAGSNDFGETGANGFTYVAWNWKANGSGVTNTAGSITSTVSANTSSGFSIVTYTGTGANATVGHGLGVAPSMIILKPRSAVDGWMTYHSALGNTKYIMLNTTAAAATGSGAWNNTSPTSSVFTIGTSGNVNTNGVTMVGYAWSEIAGFSRFGSYTGNGSADGTFVYLGFRARFILIKRTNTTGDWFIWDTARNTYNAVNLAIWPNYSSAEYDYGSVLDINSNGFKARTNSIIINNSGDTYIYMAFAENPMKYSLSR